MYHKVILTSIIRRGGRESLDTNTLINQRQSRGLRQAAGESLPSARTTQRAGRERLGPTGGRQTESWVGSPPTTALSARRAELTSPTDRSPSWIRSFHKTISPLPPQPHPSALLAFTDAHGFCFPIRVYGWLIVSDLTAYLLLNDYYTDYLINRLEIAFHNPTVTISNKNTMRKYYYSGVDWQMSWRCMNVDVLGSTTCITTEWFVAT